MPEKLMFSDMGAVYAYCKKEVYERAMKKFHNREIAEDLTSELYEMVECRKTWFLKTGSFKQTEFLVAREKRIFTQYERVQEMEVFKESMYGERFCKNDELLFIEEDNFRSNYEGVSDMDRELVEKKIFKNKSIKEIAEESGLKENTVSQRISRAMAKIKNTAAKKRDSI